MQRTLTALLGLSLTLISGPLGAQVNTGGGATTANHTKQVIGYITQWDAWKTTSAGLPAAGALTHLNIDYSKYTMLNYSFFGVAVDGSLHSGDFRNKNIHQPGTTQAPADIFDTDIYSSWDMHILFGEIDPVYTIDAATVTRAVAQGFDAKVGDTTWSHPVWGLKGPLPMPLHKETGAPGLLALAHQKGVKVMASVGGWSMCRHFPEMAADPVKRQRFVADCVKLVNTGFDGIDLDWEYPGPYSGMNFTGTAADYGNYYTLVQQIRAAIGPNKLITGAFSADPQKLSGFDWAALNGVMNHFNFMTYDYNGGWSNVAGHNSPVADYPGSEAAAFNYTGLLAALKPLGINLAKVSFGVPFYGRGVIVNPPSKVGATTVMRSENVQPDGPITTCADFTNWAKDVYDGTPNYEYVRQVGLAANGGWTRGWDASAQVPFLTKSNYFLSYDDTESITHKADFITQNGLAGAIIWTVFGDLQFGGTETDFGTKLKRWSSVQSPLVNRLNEAFAGGTTTNKPPAVSLTSPVNNTQVKTGTGVTLVAQAADPDGTVAKVEYFDGPIKLGETAATPYQWPTAALSAGTHTFTAKATDNQGASTVSAAVNVIASTTTNLPPVVSITSPANNTKVATGTGVTLVAQASDPDGTVTKVEFFDGATKLGETATSPYQWPTAGLSAGTHAFTARATDNLAATTTSAVVNVIASTTTNQPPVVSITAPANNTSYNAPATFTVTVSASDPEGALAKVELFQGSTSLGAKTASPFSWSVSALPVGTYTFKAVATDTPGLSTTSATVTVNVAAVGTKPWAPGVAYKKGDLVTYAGQTWVCQLAHTSNVAWYPGAPGLWIWTVK